MIGIKRKRSLSGGSHQESKISKQFKKHNEIDQGLVADQTEREKDLVQRSILFQPYRAFGYYTSSVPICIYKSGEDTLIATVVGKNAFYVFNTSKLNLVFMSNFIAQEITYLQASQTGLIYTSLRETNSIIAWNKMHR